MDGPRILILDEPTNHLDADSREMITGASRLRQDRSNKWVRFVNLDVQGEQCSCSRYLSASVWLTDALTNELPSVPGIGARKAPPIHLAGGSFSRTPRPWSSSGSIKRTPSASRACWIRGKASKVIRSFPIVRSKRFTVATPTPARSLPPFDLADLLERLAHTAVRAAPRPYAIVKVAYNGG